MGITWSIVTGNSIVESPNVRKPVIASSTPAEICGRSSTSFCWKPSIWRA